MSDRLADQNGPYDVSEVVGLGGRARLADLHPAIVDSAVIEQAARLIEDRSLGSDGGVDELDQLVAWIADGLAGEVILVDVVLNGCPRRRPIGVDEPELDARTCEFSGQALQFRRIAVGDRAIGAYKQKHPDGRRRGERIARLSGTVPVLRPTGKGAGDRPSRPH